MIDEKGRLFGKINLIDLLVLLVVIVVAVVLVVRMTGKTEKLPEVEVESSVIEYVVKVIHADPRMADDILKHFNEGDVQFMTNGGVKVEGSVVTGVEIQRGISSTPLEDGTMATTEDQFYVDILISARSTTTNALTNAVGTQEVRVGRGFTIKTQFIEIGGTTLSIQRVDTPAQ